MSVTGKLTVLTGAGGGIGSAMAASLAKADAQLILVARDQARLEALSQSLPGAGHCVVSADLATEAGRAAVLDSCGGKLELLINTAGVNHFGMLEQQSEQQLRQMMDVNVMAPMLLTQSLLPQLRENGGTVVNVGSGFGSIGFSGYCGYSASKFALRGFTEALRRELADTGVTVQYLAPRAVDTDMNPAEVVAMNEELGNATDSPEDVARELMSLLRSQKRSRSMGGPERFFAWLNGLFPGIVDSALARKLPIIRRYAMAAQDQAG